jgi:hypothetical protein
MGPTATAEKPAAGAAVEDEPVKARKLTIGDAVNVWAETKLAIEGLTVLNKEAAKVLLAHAEKTGKRTFKDRIAVVQTGGSLSLDQAKVKEYLGAKLTDFQTRTKLGWTLKLLK